MSGKEEGQAVKEIIIDQPELQLIRTERTSLVPVREKRKKEKPITGREYRRMLRDAWFAFGVSLGFNLVQAVVIWIQEAGPIWR